MITKSTVSSYLLQFTINILVFYSILLKHTKLVYFTVRIYTNDYNMCLYR